MFFFSTEGADDQAGVLTCVLMRPEKTDGCFWQGSAREEQMAGQDQVNIRRLSSGNGDWYNNVLQLHVFITL